MKFVVVVGDGMADEPLEELGGRTPLEVSRTPNLDFYAKNGTVGLLRTIPEGMPPGSDVANMSLMGYSPQTYYTGRAPLEAASMGLQMEPDDVAFRCNLVTLSDGIMDDFTAGHITTEEAEEIIPVLNETLGKEFPIRFHTGVSYRHIAVVPENEGATLEAMCALNCEPPHNISDKEAAPWLPKGEGQELVHAINQVHCGNSSLHPTIARKLLEEISQPSHDRSRVDSLTERETSVLKLVAQGHSNREIAKLLTVSEATVRTHVSHILAKLELSSRTQAALYALRKGLASLDDDDHPPKRGAA